MEGQSENNLANITIYNRDTMKEVGRSLRFYWTKQQTIAIGIVFLCGISLIALEKKETGVCILLAGFLVLLLYFLTGGIRAKKIMKRLTDQMNTIYHSEEFSCDMTINNEMIHLQRLGNSRDLYHSDIIKIRKAKKFFLVIYKGDLFLIVDRNGFTGGNEEQFLSLVKKKS